MQATRTEGTAIERATDLGQGLRQAALGLGRMALALLVVVVVLVLIFITGGGEFDVPGGGHSGSIVAPLLGAVGA